MSSLSKDMVQRLNLVLMSPSFYLKELGPAGDAEVHSGPRRPKGEGVCWLAGTTTCNDGTVIPSVFRVDTNAEDSLVNVYWNIENDWFQSDEQSALEALKKSENQVFPFSWDFREGN